MVHELIGEVGIVADHIDLVTFCGMDHIVNSDIFFKQAAMCVVVTVLPAEEKTTAALWIEIPKQNA